MLLKATTTKSNPSTSLAARTPANRLVRRQGAGQTRLNHIKVQPKSADSREGYILLSRMRVRAGIWTAQGALPVCACGRIPYRAFCPDPKDLTAGRGWIELAGEQAGERRWWTPLEPKSVIGDARLKTILRELTAERSLR